MTRARIQLLEELGAEFARVAADQGRGSRRFGVPAFSASPRRAVALTLVLLALASGGAYSVPATRAAIDDVTGALSGWVAGDERQAPGDRVGAGDDAPSWVRDRGGRLIAETEGVALFVTRTKSEEGTVLGFSLGGTASGREISIAGFDTLEGWRDKFDDHAVVVLGALPPRFGDQDKRFPLFGLTARSVDRVELRYESGPPLVSTDVDGGFVLLADVTRTIREIAVFDSGRELERTDVTSFANP
jgi:hypothetical protein